MEFERNFEPCHGEFVNVEDDVIRITAPNPSPFTFHGTNTYIIGQKELAIIDPGPDNDAHLETLIRAINGRLVSHIFVSHTHTDHSPLSGKLQAATGAIILAEGGHRAARDLFDNEVNPLKENSDYEFKPDLLLDHGSIIQNAEWVIQTLHTPGHTENHCAFALVDRNILFSADHVMGWSTSIVAPPDGSMSAYMRSLDMLMMRDDRVFYPGHGGAISNPKHFMQQLKQHRLAREGAIISALREGADYIEEIVGKIYIDLDPKLFGAASLLVLAHMEDLYERKIITTKNAPSLDCQYHLVANN